MIHRHHFFRSEDPDVVVDKLLNGISITRGLDLGCGDGFYCSSLLKYVKELYCVDASDWAVEEVKRKLGEKVKAVKAFAEDLPFDDEFFDLVFMANSFHDFDKERAKEEVDRVLKVGGYVAVYDWKKGHLGFGPPPWIRMSEEDYMKYFSNYEPVKKFDFGHHYGLLLRKRS